jgi:hypothetical protein
MHTMLRERVQLSLVTRYARLSRCIHVCTITDGLHIHTLRKEYISTSQQLFCPVQEQHGRICDATCSSHAFQYSCSGLLRWQSAARMPSYSLLLLNCLRQVAYSTKSSWELLRGILVFRLCGIKILVRHAEDVMKLSYRFFGKGKCTAPIEQVGGSPLS